MTTVLESPAIPAQVNGQPSTASAVAPSSSPVVAAPAASAPVADGGANVPTSGRRRWWRRTPAAPSGETRRVRKLRARLAEKTSIRGIQDDPIWTDADSPRVLQERVRSAEAAKLQAQFHDPHRRALSTARWRRNITVAAGTGLVLSLTVSTANVQATVAEGADPFGGKWWFAWSVEPAIAILMLSLFGFRAFMATRGEHVDDPWIKWTEYALLATTFVLNTWRHLPYVAAKFDFVELVAHGVWPLLAVLIVTCLPRMWAYFGDLDHGGRPADPQLVDRLTLVREWIAARTLPPTPSRSLIARTLRVHKHKISDEDAQRVFRCLTGRTELL